jgi:hypothetical protein
MPTVTVSGNKYPQIYTKAFLIVRSTTVLNGWLSAFDSICAIRLLLLVGFIVVLTYRIETRLYRRTRKFAITLGEIFINTQRSHPIFHSSQ